MVLEAFSLSHGEASALQMTRGLIHSIFVTTQRRKLVRENPVGYVEKLREQKSDVDLLTLKEVRVLLSLAKGQSTTRSWWSDLCRSSPERAPSVEAQDINFDRSVIIVARNLMSFGESLPKIFHSSEREVDMFAPCATLSAISRRESVSRAHWVSAIVTASAP
jgi:hypothetical protein